MPEKGTTSSPTTRKAMTSTDKDTEVSTDQDAVAPVQAAIDDALAAGRLVPAGLAGSDDAAALGMLACALREIAARQLESAKPETPAGLASLVKALQKLAQDQRGALQAFVHSAEELLNAEAVATAKASIEARIAHHEKERKRLQEQLSQLGTPTKKKKRTAKTATGAMEGGTSESGTATAATASADADASAATATPTAAAGTSKGLSGDVGVCLMGLSSKKVCPKSRDTAHKHLSAGDLARALGYREGRVGVSTYSGRVKITAASGKGETLAQYSHGTRIVEMYDMTRRKVTVSTSCTKCSESVTAFTCLFGKGTDHMTTYLGELGVSVKQP